MKDNMYEYCENRGRLFEKILHHDAEFLEWEEFAMEREEIEDLFETIGILASAGQEIVVLYDHHNKLSGAVALQLPKRNVIIKVHCEKSFFERSLIEGRLTVIWYADDVSDSTLASFVNEDSVLRWLA